MPLQALYLLQSVKGRTLNFTASALASAGHTGVLAGLDAQLTEEVQVGVGKSGVRETDCTQMIIHRIVSAPSPGQWKFAEKNLKVG